MNEAQYHNFRTDRNLQQANNLRFNSNCFHDRPIHERLLERPEPLPPITPEIPPLHASIVNDFGQPTGRLDDGRFLDEHGSDTGLRLCSDFSIKTRHGHNTPHSVDPSTQQILWTG